MTRYKTDKTDLRSWLLAGVVLAPGLVSAADAPAAPEVSAADAGLQEIVVTATRREDTVNHVPLSISAISAESLEKQEVRGIDDIRRAVPGIGLQFGNNGDRASTSGDTNISIRGISAITGAATTGVYLDDVPMHKTATVGSGFGAAFPRVFDLERVEVLRGPQGTLFGGSTEGGAIRYITPAPSLDTTTARVKVEGSYTETGDPSSEVGAVLGGPIKEGVLGARLSIWGRHDGGYLDHVSRLTGATLATDTNSENAWLMRGALAWKPTDALLITPAIFFQRDRHNDTDAYWENVPAFNAPAVGYNAAGPGLCNAVPITSCHFVLPAHSFPAYNMFGPGKNGNELIDPTTGAESASLSPRFETIGVGSVTTDYDFGGATLKSISSYMSDMVEGINDNTFLTASGVGLTSYPSNEVYTYPAAFQTTPYHNYLRRATQELRLSSTSTTRFTWVAGAYYSNDHFKFYQQNLDNSQINLPVERGETYQQVFGFPVWGGPFGNNPAIKSQAEVDTIERHTAGYAEASYLLTTQLKLTAGVRASHDNTESVFKLFGAQNRGFATPTLANGGLLPGGSHDSPVTPKVSLSYQITDRDMVYATASKGFRSGGFNANVQGSLLAAAGICPRAELAETPQNFGPDTVWSYEVGSKLRLGQIAQINSSAYRINWNNIQTTIATPTCGQYITNTGAAVSQGADLQAEIRPFHQLTLNANAGYDDAHYTETVAGSILGGNSILVEKGDAIPGVSKWTSSVGANYDFIFFDRNAYLSLDYQFASPARRSTGPRTVGYRSDIYEGNYLHFANFRAGVEVIPKLDVAFFVKNLGNSKDITQEIGGATVQRPYAPQLFAQTFRPREFGLSANYYIK